MSAAIDITPLINLIDEITILPPQGMSRASKILPLLPFGSTELWKRVESGDFPKPVKLGPKCTAWRNADVLGWIASWKAENEAAA